ncbi:MAG: hypothetical protein WBN04_00015 [Paracoccaceae bacterium]
MTLEVQYSDRFDYLGRSVSRRIGESVRARRQQAVDAVTQFRVTFTLDGEKLREAFFDKRPTLDDVIRLTGADAEILSIEKRRHPGRKAVARPLMLPA